MNWPAPLIAKPIAHRGLHDGNEDVPENTRAAIMAAVEANYAIELDVQMSKDGIPVVFHDTDLTRLCGRDEKVCDLTAAQLSQITLLNTDQTIEPLADILAAVDGRQTVCVEMKDNGERNAQFGKAVADVLKADQGDHCAMSFAYDLVAAFIQNADGIAAGLTAEGTNEKILKEHRDFLNSSAGKLVRFLSYNVHHLPNDLVADMRRQRELAVITWTVRSPEQKEYSDTYADQITFEGFLP